MTTDHNAADVAHADQLHARSLDDLHQHLPGIRRAYQTHGAIPAMAAVVEILERQRSTARQLRAALALALVELAQVTPVEVDACEEPVTPSVAAPGARVVLVLGQCSHWWIEHQPPDLRLSTAPRVCSFPHPGENWPASPQGLAMVPVTYIGTWTEMRTWTEMPFPEEAS